MAQGGHLAIVFAVATALCNAAAVVLQRSASETATSRGGFNLRLITDLLRKPVWLFGLAVTIGATLFWILALNSGDLSLVQPIMVVELAFIIAIVWAFSRSPVRLADWIGTAAIVVGLGVFLYVANPESGNATPGPAAWAFAGALGVVVVVSCVVMAQHGSPTRNAALYGTATAITYAFTAALIKTMTTTFHMSWSHVFLHWPVYLTALVGATGFVMEQHAFQAGPLTASQPAMIIGTPLVSIVIGIALFNERLSTNGLSIVVETGAFLLMALGVVRLTRSSLIIESRRLVP